MKYNYLQTYVIIQAYLTHFLCMYLPMYLLTILISISVVLTIFGSLKSGKWNSKDGMMEKMNAAMKLVSKTIIGLLLMKRLNL